jgi:hypothetical protein
VIEEIVPVPEVIERVVPEVQYVAVPYPVPMSAMAAEQAAMMNPDLRENAYENFLY